MLRFYPEKTKVIFFDLEYYVPPSDRNRKAPGGMTFSPILPGHKILGGTFQTYFPMQDRVGPKKIFWEWNLGSEKAVLGSIFSLLQQEWKTIESRDHSISLMLGGIGITHSDVPVLMARLSANAIANKTKIFDLLYGCRQIDLSVATFCQFSFNRAYFAYPKTKSALYQKYLAGKQMESGKAIWAMYETGDFRSIERRSSAEVDDALTIYKTMVDTQKRKDRALERLKKLDKAHALKHSVPNQPAS